MIILNIWPSSTLDKIRKELVEILLCAAQTLIASFWKTTKVPTLKDWYLKVWDFFLQDKVSIAILRADNYPVADNLQEK